MSKTVILTGLRANNDLTIGNYFGAMLPMIDMAKSRASEYQVNMFIPDLHSFTTPINHDELYEQILHNARLYAAAGLPLDDDNINLYRQSYISAHSELTWILDCFTGFGEMSRMTQFKEKSHDKLAQLLKKVQSSEVEPSTNEPAEDFISLSDELDGKYKLANPDVYSDISRLSANGLAALSHGLKLHNEDLKELLELTKEAVAASHASVGLFNYPVLMAADILLYGAKYVPVGDDQTQHLEFARDIAERMNSRFGELFVVPEPVLKQHEFFGKDQGLRIMDLVHPENKMSKSDDTGKGVIFLGDDPDEAAKKIMSATTDNLARVAYSRENQPGISNLIEILALLRRVPKHDIVREFDGFERYGDFKAVVAGELKQFLIDFQSKLADVDQDTLLSKLESSENSMRDQANQTLFRVQQAVGIRKA